MTRKINGSHTFIPRPADRGEGGAGMAGAAGETGLRGSGGRFSISGGLGIGIETLGDVDAAGCLFWSAPHLVQKRIPGASACPQEKHVEGFGGAGAGTAAAGVGGGKTTGLGAGAITGIGGAGATTGGGGTLRGAMGAGGLTASGGAGACLLWSAPHLVQKRMPGCMGCPQEEHAGGFGAAAAGAVASGGGAMGLAVPGGAGASLL